MVEGINEVFRRTMPASSVDDIVQFAMGCLPVLLGEGNTDVFVLDAINSKYEDGLAGFVGEVVAFYDQSSVTAGSVDPQREGSETPASTDDADRIAAVIASLSEVCQLLDGKGLKVADIYVALKNGTISQIIGTTVSGGVDLQSISPSP